MKQLLLLITTLFFVISCTKKDEVQFILLNEKLEFHVNPDSLSDLKNKFENITDREFSNNIVKFKIGNTTEKKYLFLIKDVFLRNLVNIEIQIFENDSLLYLHNPLINPFFTEEESLKFFNYMEFSEEKSKEIKREVKNMGFKISLYENHLNYFNQAVVINPNEELIFYSSIHLPYVVEDDILNLKNPSYFSFKKGKSYEFSLKYKLKEDIEKILPREILDNLRENNIEIFKGEIETQRIPILNIFENNHLGSEKK